MTDAVDVQALVARAVAELTGPGGRFESTVEPVLGVPIPVLRHRRRSLLELLDAARAWGGREFLVTEDRRMSFAEHHAATEALASALADRSGVEKGDRVGILAANAIEWVVAFWAAVRLGAIPVGYNAWWAPPEIAYGLGHTGPKVVIADAKRAGLLPESVPVLTMERDVPELIATHSGRSDLPRPTIAEDDPAVILYTSGTSGRPKGVVHSHRNLVAVSDYHRFTDALAAALLGQADHDGPSAKRFLLTSPLFHIASLHNLVVPRLVTGATVVIHQGSFDADRVLMLLERERVTNWGAVPTMASRLLDRELSRYDLSALTAFSLNAAPSSPALHRRLRERLPVAPTTSYGLTESGTAATVAAPPELAAFPETVGRPILGVAVEIRDPGGKPVPDGVEGEICVRSPYVMLGYWNDEAATAAAIDAERWLRTGDFGSLAEGRLYLSGRRTDLILRGGENVYPTEIENVLDEHPAVRESAVLGIAHEELGQQVAAVVVVDDPEVVGEQDLREFTAARLAYFKVPERWVITAKPLPRNVTGKVMRRNIEIG
ncbi:acyl--CoA ligase [Nocardia sp. CDC159]|uniref:Acyl--CoA ligase n=1 Tax=Nocardia pulmonis TaxID=2951408 RepID=A0A9X2IXR4_9NOCA|nr:MULTISPECIES: class I adenylate-forming enzyme family protein [Nocardia]MCM6775658.1 acyl--CoA ligase [Nocardia pulmonis]MCM6788366.1 acyl--CoA ligase [Nocardia sp. CDC159]